MKIAGIFIILYVFCEINSIKCIIGGRNAEPGEFPYVVSIREENGGHYCGGAILNKRHIVTSALCLEIYSNPTELIAVAGITSLAENGTKIDIAEILKHPRFNMSKLLHDIALLRTTTDIEFGKFIGAIALPTSDVIFEGGVPVTVTGWGDTEDGPNHYDLKVLQTETLSLIQCKIKVEFQGQQVDVHSTLCTKNRNSTGICQYDQGSPLVDKNNVLIGLASWFRVEECGSSVPDLYTRIYKHTKWLKSRIENKRILEGY